MAEPNISVDYEGLEQAAAIDRGWTTTVADWTAANTLHFAEALKRGCNRFWFPAMVSEVYRRKAGQPLETVNPEKQVDHYEWSFLRKGGSITLATGTSSYALPDDFGGSVIDESVNFAAGQGKVNLAKIDAGTIASMRSTENATGVPKYYALRPATYDGTASCDWLIEVYPTPTSAENALVVSYDYQFVPSVPTTGKYPIGGANHAATIRAAVLAELEVIIDKDPNGVHAFEFQQAIQASIRLDRQIKLAMAGSRHAYPITNLPSVRLGVDFFELQRAVGEAMQYGPNPFAWGHSVTEKVRSVIRRGYRMYLYPEAIDPTNKAHEWSWRRPTATFTTAANEKYYLLPDDFERVNGDIHYVASSNNGHCSLRHVPLSIINDRNSITTTTSQPECFSTRSVGSDGQGWQRQELILDPTPGAAYKLTYEYLANHRELSESHPYPLGGDAQAELLLTACLMFAEYELMRKWGGMREQYQRLLVGAIASDLQRAPRFLGYNGNGQGRLASWSASRRAGLINTSLVTYNGNT